MNDERDHQSAASCTRPAGVGACSRGLGPDLGWSRSRDLLPPRWTLYFFIFYFIFHSRSLSLPQLVELALLVFACVLHEGIGTETMSLPLRPS